MNSHRLAFVLFVVMQTMFALVVTPVNAESSSGDGNSDGAIIHDEGPGSAAAVSGPSARAAVVVGLCVVVLSMLFEECQEWLLEHIPELFRPVVLTLYSELTSMGFIGVIVFVLSTHFGAAKSLFSIVSDKILDSPEALPEEVEKVHFIIFFFMVLLMGFTCLALLYVHFLCKRWAEAESVATSSLDDRSFFSDPTPIGAYLRIRHRFIETFGKVSPDFDFYRYKRIVLGKSFKDLVHIRPSDWFIVGIIFLATWGAMILAGQSHTYAFLCMPWLLFFSSIVTHVHLNTVSAALIPPPHLTTSTDIENHTAAPPAAGPRGQAGTGLGEQLLGSGMASPTAKSIGIMKRTMSALEGLVSEAPTPTKPVAGHHHHHNHHVMVEDVLLTPTIIATHGSDGHFAFEELPPYLQLASPNRDGCFNRLSAKLFRPIGDRHRALFFGGARGPEIIRRVFRVRTLIMCASLAFIIAVYHEALWEKNKALPFLATIPLLLVGAMLPGQVARFALATSIERMKDEAAIHKVMRKQKVSKAMHVLRALASLKTYMTISANAAEPKAIKVEAKSVQAQEFLRMLREMFHSFDADKSGQIDKKEFVEMMRALGQDGSVSDLDALFREMDVDGSGSVSFEEMASVLIAHREAMSAAQKSQTVEEMAEELWSMFDRDGSGTISVEELLETLKRTSPQWDLTQVMQLFSEIDLNGDGTVDKEEFKEFVEEHACE